MSATVSLIASVTDDRKLGDGGRLAVRNRSDMESFRRLTMGHPVVMGRRTFESLPRPLSGRANIVMSGSVGRLDGASVLPGLPEVLEAIGLLGDVAWVAGGASVYRQLVPYASSCVLTVNHVERPDLRLTFPDLSGIGGWTVESVESGGVTDGGVAFDFVRYSNSDPLPLRGTVRAGI